MLINFCSEVQSMELFRGGKKKPVPPTGGEKLIENFKIEGFLERHTKPHKSCNYCHWKRCAMILPFSSPFILSLSSKSR